MGTQEELAITTQCLGPRRSTRCLERQAAEWGAIPGGRAGRLCVRRPEGPLCPVTLSSSPACTGQSVGHWGHSVDGHGSCPLGCFKGQGVGRRPSCQRPGAKAVRSAGHGPPPLSEPPGPGWAGWEPGIPSGEDKMHYWWALATRVQVTVPPPAWGVRAVSFPLTPSPIVTTHCRSQRPCFPEPFKVPKVGSAEDQQLV